VRSTNLGSVKVGYSFGLRVNLRTRVCIRKTAAWLSGGPGSQQAAVYRLQTRVRKFASYPRLYPTFTLPRYVDLAT